MSNIDEIKKLQVRLDNLRKIYTEDIGASYKEAAQTEDMINMLELQMRELKKTGKNTEKDVKEFVLKDTDGNLINVWVGDGNPEPSQNKFTSSSPIGKGLLLKNKGDRLMLRGVNYEIL
jgi:hypothetical protein